MSRIDNIMKILVTDDSMLARMSLKKVFSELEPSAEYIEAENGQVAVDKYKENMQDIRLVFLDLTMPVMTGYEALEEIIKINPKALVVVVSADVQPKAQERVMSSGAKAVIPKPISADKLRELLLKGII